MNNNAPQKDAERLCKIKNLETIAKYGCCAFTYLWCLGIEPDSISAIEILDDALRTGKLGEDCIVKWAEFGNWITGRNIQVEFIDIKDIKKIKERTPVRYDFKGQSHWVGVENGIIKYNSLGDGNSQCVNHGKPVTMRKISIKGIKR